MSKFNHTPGPWAHKPTTGYYYGSTTYWVPDVCHNIKTEANARLIAAAPDMLGALIEAYKFYLEAIDDYGPCDHAVNICVCGLKGQAEEIKEIIESATGLPIEEVLK